MRLVKTKLFFIAAIFAVGVSAQVKPDGPPRDTQASSPVISAPQAIYPASGRKDGIEGTVRVKVTIDEFGKVISATVVSGLEQPEFREAALVAARQSTFHPHIRDGKPAKIIRTIEYSFSLIDDRTDPKRLPIMMGTVLAIFKSMSDNLDLIPSDLLSDIPEPSNDPSDLLSKIFFGMVKKFPTLEPRQRRELADSTAAAMLQAATADEQWNLKAGQLLGSAIGPIMAFVGQEKRNDLSKFDSGPFKKDLADLLEMCDRPPKDLDPEVLLALKNVGEISKVSSPFSEESGEATFRTISLSLDKVFDLGDDN